MAQPDPALLFGEGAGSSFFGPRGLVGLGTLGPSAPPPRGHDRHEPDGQREAAQPDQHLGAVSAHPAPGARQERPEGRLLRDVEAIGGAPGGRRRSARLRPCRGQTGSRVTPCRCPRPACSPAAIPSDPRRPDRRALVARGPPPRRPDSHHPTRPRWRHHTRSCPDHVWPADHATARAHPTTPAAPRTDATPAAATTRQQTTPATHAPDQEQDSDLR